MSRQVYNKIINKKVQNTDSFPEFVDQYQKPERTKELEAYRSYFFRNNNEQTQHSSQTKIKSRMKSTRIRTKNDEPLYYELQSTKRDEDNSLRQENIFLKQTIAELKIMQLYQIDEKKIRKLLQEIQDMKKEVKNLKKENQKLKIQNDFLNRTNFQLKLQVNRMSKREETHPTQPNLAPVIRNTHQENQNARSFSPFQSIQLPNHLLLSRNNLKFSLIEQQTKPQKNQLQISPQVKAGQKGQRKSFKNYKPRNGNLVINETSTKKLYSPRGKYKGLVSLEEQRQDKYIS